MPAVPKRPPHDDHADDADDGEELPPPEVDLHGLAPTAALRKLAREIHTCRMQRHALLVVITGSGHGNALQQPILRTKVEEWLVGSEGRRLGVLSFARVNRGGALRVALCT